MKIPPIHWTTTAVALIGAGIVIQAVNQPTSGAAATAAGLAIAATAEIRHAAKWRRGIIKGLTALTSLTAAALLQTYAAIAGPEWQIAPASFAAGLPGAIIITSAKLAEVRTHRSQRRRQARAARKHADAPPAKSRRKSRPPHKKDQKKRPAPPRWTSHGLSPERELPPDRGKDPCKAG